MRSKRSRNSGLEWRRPPPFFLCISKVILIRADPLQVPISRAFMNLKPLVVCIHDNLFLYTRHITQVCFPSIQRVGCRQWQWRYHSGSWAAAQWVECALSSYFTPKCELMYAALHIKTESFFFLYQQHFSWQAQSLFFLSLVLLMGHKHTCATDC